jgi:hypothetical protein
VTIVGFKQAGHVKNACRRDVWFMARCAIYVVSLSISILCAQNSHDCVPWNASTSGSLIIMSSTDLMSEPYDERSIFTAIRRLMEGNLVRASGSSTDGCSLRAIVNRLISARCSCAEIEAARDSYFWIVICAN